MTFDEWFNEFEIFSLRCERFYDELEHYKDGTTEDMVIWLKAAYEAGYEEGQDWYVDDGK
jgi:hypothetical protein